jgi:hypothetical protein
MVTRAVAPSKIALNFAPLRAYGLPSLASSQLNDSWRLLAGVHRSHQEFPSHRSGFAVAAWGQGGALPVDDVLIGTHLALVDTWEIGILTWLPDFSVFVFVLVASSSNVFGVAIPRHFFNP